jgi:hypothetical protein
MRLWTQEGVAKLFIGVTRDHVGRLRASFTDALQETCSVFSLRAALRSLLVRNPHRFIDESRFVAMAPFSPTHLQLRVNSRVEWLAVTHCDKKARNENPGELWRHLN